MIFLTLNSGCDCLSIFNFSQELGLQIDGRALVWIRSGRSRRRRYRSTINRSSQANWNVCRQPRTTITARSCAVESTPERSAMFSERRIFIPSTKHGTQRNVARCNLRRSPGRPPVDAGDRGCTHFSTNKRKTTRRLYEPPRGEGTVADTSSNFNTAGQTTNKRGATLPSLRSRVRRTRTVPVRSTHFTADFVIAITLSSVPTIVS